LWDTSYRKANLESSRAYDHAEGIDAPEAIHPAVVARVRSLLLQRKLGDLMDPRHPARHPLTQRLHGKLSVDDVYARRLLLIDYRLAALRYALGIEPVEDYWYLRPQILPTPGQLGHLDQTDIQRRIFYTRRALRRAMYQAEYLDQCFECDWRKQEILGRKERLEEMVSLFESL
jgi:hypothetical protein